MLMLHPGSASSHALMSMRNVQESDSHTGLPSPSQQQVLSGEHLTHCTGIYCMLKENGSSLHYHANMQAHDFKWS